MDARASKAGSDEGERLRPIRCTAVLALGVALLAGPLTVAAPAETGSTDGKIAFGRRTATDARDIFATEPDGSDAVNATNTPDIDENDPQWSPAAPGSRSCRRCPTRVTRIGGTKRSSSWTRTARTA